MGKYQAQLDSRREGREDAPRWRRSPCSRTSSSKYRNDDRWTPDAMFRLAELYFEKSNDEYLTATQRRTRRARRSRPTTTRRSRSTKI